MTFSLARVRPRVLAALALALSAWLLITGAAYAQNGDARGFPDLTGRVVDAANILPPDKEAALTAKLASLEAQSHRQLVVATIPDLKGNDIADYGYQLGRAWGIGAKGKNDGALLIVAPNERKVRIEVGYGLEGVLTDALASRIIRTTIIPYFKDSDYPGGITAGVNEISRILTLPPAEAQKLAAEAASAQDDGGDNFWIVFAAIFGFIIIANIISARRRGYRWGQGPVILWGGSNSSSGWSWGGSGGFGGGFGDGGGFSGGGGSFGGGGASGGW